MKGISIFGSTLETIFENLQTSTLVSRYQAGHDNETPSPSVIRYRASLNLPIRAQKGPDNELYTKQQFGPITRP
jgi:hypothetical protein